MFGGQVEGPPQIRQGVVLIVDIAGNVGLHTQFGEAAASRRIRHLLDGVIQEVRARGGVFIKSYGDDVVAVYEAANLAAAAETAIRAQRLAEQAGLQLYAGLHGGPLQFGETMGHLMVLGQTVNFAARLHKLTEDAPGQIFLTEDSVLALPEPLRERAARYGRRLLKGLGTFSIWTLEWREADSRTSPRTEFVATDTAAARALLLRHAGGLLRLEPDGRPCILGRDAACTVQVADPLSRVSSRHLVLQSADGHWLAQDISRNGSWLRRDGAEPELLPYCIKASLPPAGSLCLGRPFADDPEGRCSLGFSIGGD